MIIVNRECTQTENISLIKTVWNFSWLSFENEMFDSINARCGARKKWPIVKNILSFYFQLNQLTVMQKHHDVFSSWSTFLWVGFALGSEDGTQLEIAQKREKTFTHHTKIHLKDSWYFRIARKLFFKFLSCKHAVTNVIFFREIFNAHFPLWNSFFFELCFWFCLPSFFI